MKLIYLKPALKCDSFDVAIGIKIPFFRVLVTIEPGRSLLQFVTTNCLIHLFKKKSLVQKKFKKIIGFSSVILLNAFPIANLKFIVESWGLRMKLSHLNTELFFFSFMLLFTFILNFVFNLMIFYSYQSNWIL